MIKTNSFDLKKTKSQKLLLKYKLIFFYFLFFCSGSLYAESNYSQEARLSLQMENGSLKEAFSEIESQSNFIIFYSDDVIDASRKVSISVEDKSIEEVLDKLLASTNNTYTISGKQVFISHKTANREKSPQSQEQKQIQTVTGVVKDAKGEALIGVSVTVKGTKIGTVTGLDGGFSLNNVPENATITVTYIGYISQEVPVRGSQKLEVTLLEDAQALSEVVIVGYGTQKKENLSGSVTSVDSKVLENRPVASAVTALQGTMPGVFVTPSSGDPNANWGFNIRGTTSINGGSPLVLVDGVESTLKLLNPNDIENVTVLKDAAASSIYGVRGAFGVILITTKKGSMKKTTISYSGNMSWSKPTILPEFVKNSYDHARFVNLGMENEGLNPLYTERYFGAIEAYYKDPSLPEYYIQNGQYFFNGYNDWRKILTKEYSPKQQHNISISGGTENTNYYISGGYTKQDGFLKVGNDVFSRYNILSKMETKLTDWARFGLKITYNTSKMNRPFEYNNNNYFHSLVFSSPLSGGVWKGDPNYPQYDRFIGYSFEDQNYEVRLQKGGRVIEKATDFIFTPSLDITPIKNMNIHVDFSYRKSNSDNSDYKKRVPGLITNKFEETEGNTVNNFYELSRSQTDYFALNAYTDYSFSLAEKHNFKVMVGYNQELTRYNSSTGQRNDMLSLELPSLSLGTGDQFVTENGFEWALRGAFSRINYNYDERYLLELNGRYDGTSRFPRDDRFVFVPSFSVAWRLSEESFMSFVKPLFDNIKFKGSYGKLGNQFLSSSASSWAGNRRYYPYIPFYTQGRASNYLFGGEQTTLINPPGLIPASLTWEKVSSINGGLEVVMLASRLDMVFELYKRTTSDMLIAQEYPEILGTAAPVINEGELETRGWEFNINWRDKIGADFNYSVGFNIFDARATITKWRGTPITTGNYKGKRIGEIWGYVTEGIFQSEEEIENHASQAYINKGVWTPGDIKYKDLNGDGKVDIGTNTIDDPGDRQVIGNTAPRYNYGFRGEASYKGIFFNVFFQGVGKRDFYPSGQAYWPVATQYYNTQQWFVDDSWSEDNRNAYFAKPRARNTKNYVTQTRFLQDASYLRLKNLTIGYNLPEKWVNKVSLSKAQVYFSGENLWEISSVKGAYDPESAINNGGLSYPFQRVFSFGIDLTF